MKNDSQNISYGSLKKRDISLKHFVSTPVFSLQINRTLGLTFCEVLPRRRTKLKGKKWTIKNFCKAAKLN